MHVITIFPGCAIRKKKTELISVPQATSGATSGRHGSEKNEEKSSSAAEHETGTSERQARRQRPANWKGKQEVLEQVNELILELDGIAGSISIQVNHFIIFCS